VFALFVHEKTEEEKAPTKERARHLEERRRE
jgi:hypothetical protein